MEYIIIIYLHLVQFHLQRKANGDEERERMIERKRESENQWGRARKTEYVHVMVAKCLGVALRYLLIVARTLFSRAVLCFINSNPILRCS